ncbi:MAG: hypothetical protein M1815_000710, partial [Lichina confinis]
MSNDSQTASINGSRNAEGTSWSFGLSSSDPTGFTGPTSGIDSPLSPPTDKERDVWKQYTWLYDSDDSTGLADKSSAKPDLNPEDAILHSGKLFENQVIDEDPRLHDDVQLEDARYGGPDDSSLPPQATGADEEVTRTLNPMQRYVTEGSQVPEKIRVPQPQAFGSVGVEASQPPTPKQQSEEEHQAFGSVGVEASQPPTPKQQSEEEHDEVQLEDGQDRVSDCPAIAPQDALEDGEVAQMSSPLVPASSSHGIVSAPSKETETPAEPTSTSKRKRGPGKEQQPGGKRAGGRGKRKHICVQCQYTHEKACVFDKEHGCCTSCLKSKRDRNLCLVLYLNDCECHRRGNARAGEGKSGCPSLPFISDSESKRTTQIRQHFSNPQGPVPTLIINCMRFREDKSTVLVELFETFDGVIFAVESTPFACIDVGVPFQKGVEEYLDKCTMLAINDLLLDDARASTNTGKRLTDMIGWTVTEACRLVDNKWCSNTPLASALKILATAWMSTKQAIIVGEDKLDMKAVEHPNSYISDQVPVTSCVDTQLDNAAQTYMDRLTAQVVIALKEMMGLKANKKGKTSDQKEEGTSKSKETRSCKTYEIFLT